MTAHALAADVPAAWVDDAQLHDVQLVGLKIAFAVGEHGAIWKSEDGGRTWVRLNCGHDVSLRSVCFLTDQIGWIAGGDLLPYSGLDEGLLLATQDGGKTWQKVGRDPLPALAYVKFFGLEEGVVVGQPTPLAPAGIYKTDDGGQSWRGVQGDASQSWKAMCFLEPELGLVAGANGRVSLMGGEQLFASQLVPQGVRSIHALSVQPNETGWLAGDGGLVLKTTSGGVAWESPPNPLPEELRTGMDFRAVHVRGDKVWLAGSPGSVIWHSPDGGKRWARQSTGQTAPLAAVRFTNDEQGIAVGTFGLILRTENGGKIWHPARGAGRRAALLSLHARPGQTTVPLLTKLSGEQGYRSAVWIAQRNDMGPLAAAKDGESRLQAAIQKCGANAAEMYWQLPQNVPGIEFSSEKLLAEWQKQTEGKLPQTLLGGSIRQIRTWRPNIIVIDQPAVDDAASQLLFDATILAVEQASDATRYTEQTELTGLAPWTVDRVYVRLAAGANGDAHIELDEFLPHLKSSNRVAGSTSIALLHGGRVPVIETIEAPRIAYRWWGLDGSAAEGGSKGTARSRDFFGGLSIAAGSAARRDSLPFDDADLERMQKLAQNQRNITAIAQRSFDDPRVAAQMLGQLNGIVEGMEAAQAAIVLRDLADEYRKRSKYELVEATYVELIKRCPKEPASLDAMRWLIQFWCSNETAWQRARAMSAGTTLSQSELQQHTNHVQQALGQTGTGDGGVTLTAESTEGSEVVTGAAAGSAARLTAKFDFDEKPAGKKGATNSARMKFTRDTDWRSGAVSEWQTRAIGMAKQLEARSPTMFHSPDVQFPLAALRRTKGSSRAADEIMRTFVTNPIDAETRQLAERELWTSYATIETPAAISMCHQVGQRPHLDGLLSDPCWEEAKELRLTSTPAVKGDAVDAISGGPSMVMFAYDPQFLYVALSVPRAEGTPKEGVQSKGRQHDADLSRHDRMTIRLDIDRDYATFYEFQVDQRGWTAESCWEDRRWNPKWFVAAQADDTDWRIEAAIPWNDLTPTPPQPGTIYGISVLRTIPGVGLQSWTHPATSRVQPTSFGLLKFD